MNEPPLPLSPYKGLTPFEDSEVDALFFFGRDRDSEVIAANLMASRLTILFGPTGVGKTSVLRAGVAHKLRQEANVEVRVHSSWVDDPGAALADLPSGNGGDLYLMLDQFEEFFLYHEFDRAFADELAEVVRRPDLRVNVLIGIRADSLARLDAFKAAIPNLFSNRLRLENLDRAAGEAAIRGPIGRFNELVPVERRVEVEAALVDAVLDEVAAGRVELGATGRGVVRGRRSDDRVETPFLQLVMSRLWNVETGRGSKVLRLETLSELGGAAKIVEALYRSPYLSHATMEPQTCTAWLKPEGFLDVWTSTQNGEASLAQAAEVAGLPLEKVEVHKMMLGGGFGRRGGPQDFVRHGVAIAKSMPGVPVKMMCSREEDMQHDYYRPASIVRIKAGLDAQGRPIAMHTTIACPSIMKSVFGTPPNGGIDFTAVRSFNDMPYAIANQQVDYAMRNGHVPVGFWRAPGQQNAFYRECFVDELAQAASKDPVEFRLALLKPDDKNRGVLEAVAKAAGWGTPLPQGVHRGIAMADGFGSYAAAVAEVSVTPEGEPKVHRVVIAIDSGYVVNPDTCRAQAESNVVYGLGSILYQEINVKNGRVAQSNFHDFALPRIHEMPKVETVLVPTGGFWGGHGEPAILPLIPAVCNAISAATGKRVRSLPLKHVDLRHA
jgi:hypothetical protein